MVTIDGTRFPRVQQFLESLPNGLASYPDCEGKGSLLRTYVEFRQRAPLDPSGLPDLVARVFTAPIPHSAWFPETVFWSALFAIFDHDRMSDPEAIAYMGRANMVAYNGPVFRFLMSLASPQTLVNMGSSRWSSMHRGGTRLESIRSEANECELRLDFPESLFGEFALKILAESFQAALANARAKDATMKLTEFSSTRATFVSNWK